MALGAAQLTGLGRYLAPTGPATTYMAITGLSSPYQQIYEVTIDGASSSLSLLSGEPNTTVNPSSNPVGRVQFNPQDNTMAHQNEATPYLYAWTESAGSWTKISNLTGSDIPNQMTSCPSYAWSPDGNYLVYGANSGTTLHWYSWNGSAFTKLTSPTSLPATIAWTTAWHPDSDILFVSDETSPYYHYYKRSGTTLTDTTPIWDTAPSTRIFGSHWSSDGSRLAVCFIGGDIWVYTFNKSTDTFTLEYSAAAGVGNIPTICCWNPNGDQLIVGGASGWKPISRSGSSYTQGSLNSWSGVRRMSVDWTSDGSLLFLKEATSTNSGLRVYHYNGSSYSLLSSPWDTAPSVGNEGGVAVVGGPKNRG